MNTPWRSSFHHFVVAMSGTRRSTSRASASAARRTSVKDHSGRIRTFTWIPFLPLVLGKPASPCSSSTSFVTRATSRTWSNGISGPGSRSTRSSSGWSTSDFRTGHGLISRQPEGRGPREVRGVRHHRHVGGPPAREPDQRRLHPRRCPLRQSLLIEALVAGSVREPVQRRRPVAAPDEGGVRDLDPVPDEVELRDRTVRRVGEVHLLRVRDPDLPPCDLEGLGWRRHPTTVPVAPSSRPRYPRRRGGGRHRDGTPAAPAVRRGPVGPGRPARDPVRRPPHALLPASVQSGGITCLDRAVARSAGRGTATACGRSRIGGRGSSWATAGRSRR